MRERFGPSSASLVGITHTMSTRRIIEGLHHLMLQPVHPWDAIICVKGGSLVVATQLEEAAFIKHRFGASDVPMPQLPIIPLQAFIRMLQTKTGPPQAMRERLGASRMQSLS